MVSRDEYGMHALLGGGLLGDSTRRWEATIGAGPLFVESLPRSARARYSTLQARCTRARWGASGCSASKRRATARPSSMASLMQSAIARRAMHSRTIIPRGKLRRCSSSSGSAVAGEPEASAA